MKQQDRTESFDVHPFEVQIDGRTIGRFEELADAIASAQITKTARPKAALSVKDTATGQLIAEISETHSGSISEPSLNRLSPGLEPGSPEPARPLSVLEKPPRHEGFGVSPMKQYRLHFQRQPDSEAPSIIVAATDDQAIKIARRLPLNAKFQLWERNRLVKSVAPKARL